MNSHPMLERLRFPFLYVLEVAVWIPLLLSFYGVVSFVAARPIASLELRGKSLPASWEAAVFNHGRYLEGYLTSNHPVVFTTLVVVLAASVGALFYIHKAQSAQRRTDSSSGQRRSHVIAQAVVFAVLATVGYYLVMHALVGINAV